MVVDDDPVNLQVLANQLTLEGYQVCRALQRRRGPGDIQGGLTPDLLILDVMMPLIRYEVCRCAAAILSICLDLTPKTRFQTGRGLQAGANDYLLKPFDRREMLAPGQNALALKQ